MAIKTISFWRKTHNKAKVSEWLQTRKTVNPARIRTSLLFAALQEVIVNVGKMVLQDDASREKGSSGDAANLGELLLDGLDNLSRGSRKLELRIDAVEQGVTLTREVIENCLHDWQEAITQAIIWMQIYQHPVLLVTRLRQLKALHRDLYTSITRALKRKGMMHAVAFKSAGERHGEKLSNQDGVTRKHIKNEAAEKRESPRVSLKVDTRRKGRLKAEKDSKTRLSEHIVSEKGNKVTQPPKQPENSPKASVDTVALLKTFRRPRSKHSTGEHTVRSVNSESGHSMSSSQAGRSGFKSSLDDFVSNTASGNTKSHRSSQTSQPERTGSLSLRSLDILDQSTLGSQSDTFSDQLSFESVDRSGATQGSLPSSLAKTPSSIIEERSPSEEY